MPGDLPGATVVLESLRASPRAQPTGEPAPRDYGARELGLVAEGFENGLDVPVEFFFVLGDFFFALLAPLS